MSNTSLLFYTGFTMTRRDLMLATPAALLAQTPQQPQQSPPQSPPSSPDAELNAAREQQHRNAEQLAKVALPMATEPACHFKA